MKFNFQNTHNFIRRVLGSRGFLVFIIILFAFQSAWIAFSFRYPMLYDEYFHVNVIKLFSQQLSPFITSQPTSYDIFGVLSYGVATLFHYLMSFPYRAISVFTDNLAIQVISMRLVCIAFTAVGIVLFNKLFQKIGIKQVFINVALLLFVLLPIVPFVAATVNYDNMHYSLLSVWIYYLVKK